MFRIKIEFGNDGSLESRLYLSGAGPGDAGPYSCLMPGMESVNPATVNISVTMGEKRRRIHKYHRQRDGKTDVQSDYLNF